MGEFARTPFRRSQSELAISHHRSQRPVFAIPGSISMTSGGCLFTRPSEQTPTRSHAYRPGDRKYRSLASVVGDGQFALASPEGGSRELPHLPRSSCERDSLLRTFHYY